MPKMAARAVLDAFDALITQVQTGGPINAAQCAEWAGECEVLLSRIERVRLSVRTKCTPEALALLQENGGNARLAHAMSLGTSATSLLRKDSNASFMTSATSLLRNNTNASFMSNQSTARIPPAPPRARRPPPRLSASQASAAFSEATDDRDFYPDEAELPPDTPLTNLRRTSHDLERRHRKLATSVSLESSFMYHGSGSNIRPASASSIQSRVDCWRRGPRAKPARGRAMAAQYVPTIMPSLGRLGARVPSASQPNLRHYR